MTGLKKFSVRERMSCMTREPKFINTSNFNVKDITLSR